MNTTGTIDRPAAHGPVPRPLRKAEPAMALRSENHASTQPDMAASCQNRTRDMQLIPEAMARAHMHERMREAEAERPGRRVVVARRMQRRAERASMRARRALALAVMQ
ncbi:hypothetical protein F0L17_17620 [Streptomyces sp. TRM43335]|uniref:Uncharacterized protein n=1 Tax=Streptomyces taklimakanensis TaxID=2569853 RepID=A0A6G2BG72_9ACTN|nr:hypothetical protein [Streptomyces taklimakanensis]MTE20902.1 hypothetical protein [Streptomyces taklimakanensis]